MTTIPTEPSQPRAGVGTPDRKRSSALLWLLARRVHFMAGLLVAPFLAWTTGRPRRCGCASSTATCTWATSVGSIPSSLPAGCPSSCSVAWCCGSASAPVADPCGPCWFRPSPRRDVHAIGPGTGSWVSLGAAEAVKASAARHPALDKRPLHLRGDARAPWPARPRPPSRRARARPTR